MSTIVFEEFDAFLAQEKHIVEWMNKATTAKERSAAAITLQNLHKLRTEQVMMGEIVEATTPAPRKKLTKVERFDKKNSRREAIMAQRARRG